MASVTARGGKFFARVRREGKTVAKTFSKRSDAEAWGRRVESEIERGTWVAPQDVAPTLAQAIATYREAVAVHLKGIRVYDCYFREFARERFAAKPVNEVSPFDIAAWRDQQLTRFVRGTVTRKLATLGAVFTWAAKERGWLEKNPLALVTKPRVDDARDRVLSEAEQQYLLAEARNSKAVWFAPAIKALMFSAMRRGELFGLRRRDVDFDAATAYLPETKAGGSRLVPLSPDALAALRVLAGAASKGPDAKLLPLAHVGSISDVFQSVVERARARYEVDSATRGADVDPGFLADVRLHDLRHHAVTMWASTGGLTLPELMAVSGHRNPKMLMRYTHLSASKLAGKLAMLSAPASEGAAA
jgi:integrase